MLIEFRVSNFKSIREEQVFSLIASSDKKNCPESVIEQELPGMKGLRYLKGAAIYGANAAGKSTLIQALHSMWNYVGQSATEMKPDAPTGRTPFLLDEVSRNAPTSFELTFVAEGVRYQYGFALSDTEVVEEYLIAYPKGSAQKWFNRSKGSGKEWVTSSYFKGHSGLQEKTRKNALYLSVGATWNHPQLSPVYEWISEQLRFLDLTEWEALLPLVTMKQIAGDEERKAKIWSLMQTADFGLSNMLLETVDVPVLQYVKAHPDDFDHIPDNAQTVKEHRRLFLEHQIGDDSYPIDWRHESAGTRRFFGLLGPWLDTMEQGYTVFIDELDTSLHPVLVREILKLLFSDAFNPNGAQVIFTTHNPTLLDQHLIRRDQVWFTEKDKEGATHVYPLTDYSPRSGEALAKGYLAGRYGAIPFIDEGLRF